MKTGPNADETPSLAVDPLCLKLALCLKSIRRRSYFHLTQWCTSQERIPITNFLKILRKWIFDRGKEDTAKEFSTLVCYSKLSSLKPVVMTTSFLQKRELFLEQCNSFVSMRFCLLARNLLFFFTFQLNSGFIFVVAFGKVPTWAQAWPEVRILCGLRTYLGPIFS